ncbi:hypothetical protein FACS1894211_16960 [Clostridia bacterium]|nr:hypothetical protein FACS1894211_16960 [Clostridia bacterium]
MSIDENISHLEAQKKLLEHMLSAQDKVVTDMEAGISQIEQACSNLRKLERIIKEDLVKVRGDYSSAQAYEKMLYEETLQKLELIASEIQKQIDSFATLGSQWREYIAAKEALPKDRITAADRKKLFAFRDALKPLLKLFDYHSSEDFNPLQISEDTFLPEISGFDMRFDSSASDTVRSIWAFTLALQRVSYDFHGNHPNVFVFDEPKQQNVVDASFKSFCETLVNWGRGVQFIVAVTAKDIGIREMLKSLDSAKYSLIDLSNRRAFEKLA